VTVTVLIEICSPNTLHGSQ